MSPRDQKYLEFGRMFEEHFVCQGQYENRTITQTMNLAWRMLSFLPQEDLLRVTEAQVQKYFNKDGESCPAEDEEWNYPEGEERDYSGVSGEREGEQCLIG